MATTSKIPAEIIEIFGRGVIENDSFFKLPNQYFSRPVYEEIKKVIENCGGKWKKKLGGFTFVAGGIQRLRAAIGSGETINVQQVTQFFPTPPDVARVMAAMLDLYAGQSILEPSVGAGALLDAVFLHARNAGIHIARFHAVEKDREACEAFEKSELFADICRKSHASIMCGDFLQAQTPAKGFYFDRVIMNPPFSRGDDIKHILHAWEFLKVGGKLVALCANGPKQNAILKPWSESLGGTWEVLPAGTFKDSGAKGTNIETVLLTANA